MATRARIVSRKSSCQFREQQTQNGIVLTRSKIDFVVGGGLVDDDFSPVYVEGGLLLRELSFQA